MTAKTIFFHFLFAILNIGIYIYALLFCAFILAQNVNGWLIPDYCFPSESPNCIIIVPLVLWGGAFFELLLFSCVIFFLNRAVLRSYLFTWANDVSKVILILEIALGGMFFCLIGILTR